MLRKPGVFEADTTDRPGRPEQVQDFPGGIKDQALINLGPVYEMLGVEVDLLEQFAFDTNQDVEVSSYRFNSPILNGLNEWSCLLQGVPLEHKSSLYSWLGSQEFRREGDTWRLAGEEVSCANPNVMIASPDTNVTFAVALPHGNRGTTSLVKSEANTASLKFTPSYESHHSRAVIDRIGSPDQR